MRKRAINDRVSAHDILRMKGVPLLHVGEREEQFSCPFHGKDAKPSARVFPSTPQSPSHAWCYVCRERWDVIALWQKYNGTEGFHRTLSDIEKAFNITTPPVPQGAIVVDYGDSQKQRFEEIYAACESRLVGERYTFDMQGYLLFGSILDKCLYQVNQGDLSYAEGIDVVNKVMVRIGQKVRGAPPS